MLNLKCPNCGWVHFGVTRAHAEAEVESFNSYIASLDEKSLKFWGPILEDGTEGEPTLAHISHYEHCDRCRAPYNTFIEAKASEVPYGSTLNALLIPESLLEGQK